MGCGSSRVQCPKCGKNTLRDGGQLVDHLKEHHRFGSVYNNGPPVAASHSKLKTNCKFCGMAVLVDALADHLQAIHITSTEAKTISCPNCNINGITNGQTFLQHLKDNHGFVTLKGESGQSTSKEMTSCKYCGLQVSKDELADHLQNIHINGLPSLISCPKCVKTDIKDGEEFLDHLKQVHAFTVATLDSLDSDKVITHDNKMLPKVGDTVLAMWSKSKWQYFHATIVKFIPENLRYEIDWDDGDTTGRIVDYFNIAVDKIPDENEIGIGSIILFPQGSYKAGDTQMTGGKRWHQGKITKIYWDGGRKYYDGVHTKGKNDGKFVTYKGYSYEFTRCEREEFRVGPNVFNILGDTLDETVSTDDIDVYFSCTKPNERVENGASEESYNPIYIVEHLKSRGLKVVEGESGTGKTNLMEKVNMMKNSKVFIACISDDYVVNEQCRMEFQYAKSTLRKPVVPLVIGQSKEWTMSVVGMLIAGELYIHFKDKSVEEQKLQEVLRSLALHISDFSVEIENEDQANLVMGPGDIFISYCWYNSFDAKENNQITSHNGTEYSDPRFISRKIFDFGYKTWLDVERLKSADQNAGLFEQLTEALKQAKLVVPCISDEYANSINCRMEFQFALNSLQKQIIPIVVGTGDEWKKTVVGKLLESNNIDPIDFQLLSDVTNFDAKFKHLIDKINTVMEEIKEVEIQHEATVIPKPRKSRAPNVNDHVICHQFNYCYYMATVESFNRTTMEYTVRWDDGDKHAKVQPFNQVALDEEPEEDDVGVGSIIFFPQGEYAGTHGANAGGVRYHEGIITSIKREHEILVSGHHTRGPDDRKRCNYRGYLYDFTNIPLREIRVAPTALETFGIE